MMCYWWVQTCNFRVMGIPSISVDFQLSSNYFRVLVLEPRG